MKATLSPLIALLATGLLLKATVALAGLPQHDPVPGGVVVVELGEVDQEAADQERPEVRYRDRDALVVREGEQWVALLGVPLSAETGERRFTVRHADGSEETHSFEVGTRDYGESRITIDDERMVTPDEEDLERIAEDRKEINAAIAYRSDRNPTPLSFELPIRDVETSAFGMQRYINDQRRNPHSGLDIRGAEGTPIHAPAPGEVIETGDYYFNGKTVFLDHGQGLISMFAHMSEISVAVGDSLETGDLVGKAGATGRVTGPHLHWTVALNGVIVNPRLFVADESPLDADEEEAAAEE